VTRKIQSPSIQIIPSHTAHRGVSLLSNSSTLLETLDAPIRSSDSPTKVALHLLPMALQVDQALVSPATCRRGLHNPKPTLKLLVPRCLPPLPASIQMKPVLLGSGETVLQIGKAIQVRAASRRTQFASWWPFLLMSGEKWQWQQAVNPNLVVIVMHNPPPGKTSTLALLRTNLFAEHIVTVVASFRQRLSSIP
jgi:hypothetical protein